MKSEMKLALPEENPISLFTVRNAVIAGSIVLVALYGAGIYYRGELFGSKSVTSSASKLEADKVLTFPFKANCSNTVGKAEIDQFLSAHGGQAGGAIDNLSFGSLEAWFKAAVDIPKGCSMDENLSKTLFDKTEDNKMILNLIKEGNSGKYLLEYESLDELLIEAKTYIQNSSSEYSINFNFAEEVHANVEIRKTEKVSADKNSLILRFSLPIKTSFDVDGLSPTVEFTSTLRRFYSLKFNDVTEYAKTRLRIAKRYSETVGYKNVLFTTDDRGIGVRDSKRIVPLNCDKEPFKRELKFGASEVQNLFDLVESENLPSGYSDCKIDFGEIYKLKASARVLTELRRK